MGSKCFKQRSMTKTDKDVVVEITGKQHDSLKEGYKQKCTTSVKGDKQKTGIELNSYTNTAFCCIDERSEELQDVKQCQIPASSDFKQNQSKTPLESFENDHNRPASASDVKTEVDMTQHVDAHVASAQSKCERLTNVKKAFEDTNENSVDEREYLKGKNKKHKKEKKKKKKEKKKEEEERKHLAKEPKIKMEKENSPSYESECVKLKEEIDFLKQEKNELLKRLSAMASARLTDGNPNIADLSDSNRPTKLAEQYSELYDNEWTEAFDVLKNNNMSEESVCRLLLQLLCLVYKMCLQKADDEWINAMDTMKVLLGKQELPLEVIKPLKDLRKKNIAGQIQKIRALPGFSEGVERILQIKSEHEDRIIEKYLNRCVEISWFMVIQDPPVFVDINIKRDDELFDKNELKEYTKSGKYIDFIVWPPLYLYKGGNILCKGVAECKSDYSNAITRIRSISENETKLSEGEIQAEKGKKNLNLSGITAYSADVFVVSSTKHLLKDTDEPKNGLSPENGEKDENLMSEKKPTGTLETGVSDEKTQQSVDANHASCSLNNPTMPSSSQYSVNNTLNQTDLNPQPQAGIEIIHSETDCTKL